MLATEEAVIRGEGRGMRGFQYEMFRPVNVRAFLFCIISPEHEDEVSALLRKRANNTISKLLPTHALMRAGGVRADSERRIE